MADFSTLVLGHYLFGKNYETVVRAQVVCHVWKHPVVYKDIYMRKRGKLVEIMLPELFDEATDDIDKPAATSIEVNTNMSDPELKLWFGPNITEQYFTCLAYPGTNRGQRGIHSCNIRFMATGKMLISPAKGSFIRDTKFGCGTFSTVLTFINDYDESEAYKDAPPVKRPSYSNE